MKVHLASLGCKLNQSEMETLARELAAHGHQVVAGPSGADAVVLNTCAVTTVAARKSAQLARRLYRESEARLILTGCFAELSPDEAGALPGVAALVSNRDKERLFEILQASFAGAVPPGKPALAGGTAPVLRTRASVKFQDGCDNECTYCVVRHARGPQRSRPNEQVMAEIRAHLSSGYREIVLTGVHIGSYGRDRAGTGDIDLWGLVREILRDTDLPRLRLSSIEPWDITAEDLRVWSEPRLCRHLHLPLQSGCDEVLARMRRRYTAAQFSRLVEAARRIAPDIAITTDVIVGFPGETDVQFEETLRFVEAMRFARVHVFPYSARPGTPAAAWPDQASAAVKHERSQALQDVGRAQATAFRRQFVGRTMNVLWETRGASGEWSGLTDNYLRVFIADARDLHNEITPTHLTTLTALGLRGEVTPRPQER